MLRSSVDRFGVTYQGKVGDDVEVRVNGIVERFVKLVLLFKTSHDDHENSNAWFSLILSSLDSCGAPLCGPSGR